MGDKQWDLAVAAMKTRTGMEPTTFQGAAIAGHFTISGSTPRLDSGSVGSRFQLDEREFIDQHYRNSFKLANISIPLPEGRWTGLAYQPIGVRGEDDYAVVFYQRNEAQLAGLFAVRLKLAPDRRGFPSSPGCSSNAGYESVVERNGDHGDQLCYWVEHVTNPWELPIFELAAKRLDDRGITVPGIVVNAAFHDADRDRSLTSYYYTNPGVDGIETQPSNWQTSPWHPQKLAQDDRREAFVQDKLDWSSVWFQILKASQT